MKVALVSCVKAKRSQPSAARDLYTSQLFRKASAFAMAHADEWYILSAKHGLLSPDVFVDPYEQTLNAMGSRDRRSWSERVQRQLVERLQVGAEVIILAGIRYREHIEPFLLVTGFAVTVPLAGRRIGEQLRWLNRAANGGTDGI